MTTGSTAAGWYTDPTDPRLIRWWDGSAWTDHTQPNPSAPAAPALPSVAPLEMPVSSAPYVPPPFADPAPARPVAADPAPPRPVATDPVPVSARRAAAPAVPAPAVADPLPSPRSSVSSLPISEPVRLVPPSASASSWTAAGTMAQPSGSVDFASVDYEPMTRTWGAGRGAGTQRTVTGVSTAGAWMLALSPVLHAGLLALGWAVTEGGASPMTTLIGAALGAVAVLWVVLSVILDFRRLGALGHEFRPSVAWILLGPFFYLTARAIHVYRTTKRGTAPTWVFVVLAAVVGAGVAVAALALPREASAADLRAVEQRLTAQLQQQGLDYSVLCPSQASASLGSSFVCTASDDVGPAALIRVTWTGLGDFTYEFESTGAALRG